MKMPCESCAIQFSVFRRKRACSECDRYYCSGCLRRGGGVMCAPCRVLSTRPLVRQCLANLKVRDLQCFLHRQNVSTRQCVEKEDLIGLVVQHVNSAAYRRRGPRSTPSAFSSLKGFTNNINELLNSAFDIRPSAANTPTTPNAPNCHNSSHEHVGVPRPWPGAPSPATAPTCTCAPAPQPPRQPPPRQPPPRQPPPPNITTTQPDAEADSSPSPPDSVVGERRDTADCFEMEDLDDAGWEFVVAPADPLPTDCPELLRVSGTPVRATAELEPLLASGTPIIRTHAELDPLCASGIPIRVAFELDPLRASGTPVRAASELELRVAPPPAPSSPGAASLQDESVSAPNGRQRVELSELSDDAQLETLSVRQLKELLALNRVDYRACIERADLLQRARLLWRDSDRHRRLEPDQLPLAEACKICMSAPLECVLLECGHIAACTACAKQLAECPICRQYVVRAVRFFRS